MPWAERPARGRRATRWVPLALGWGLNSSKELFAEFYQSCSLRDILSMRRFLQLSIPWILTAVLGLALLASWSRGGWLGAAAAAIAILYFLPLRRWQGAVGVLVIVVLAGGMLNSGLLPSSVADRLTGFADYVQFQDVRGVDITPASYAVLERMAHWQAAFEMATHQPWLGVGFGNYEAAYSDYSLLNWPYPLGHAHNYYLNLLAETGVLGLLAYLAFWGSVMLSTIRIIGRSRGFERGIALGLMGVWVHLAVHHLVDKLYVNNIYLHLGALLGLLLLLNDRIFAVKQVQAPQVTD